MTEDTQDQILSELANALSGEVGATHLRAQDLLWVLSRAGIGVLHRDLDHNILTVNDHFCALVGRPFDDLQGMSMEVFTHPDDLEGNLELYRAKQARGEAFDIEKRYIRKDGSSVWCAVNVSFVRDSRGQIASTVAIVRDISDQLSTKRQLRVTQEQYTKVVGFSPQITWTASPTGQIVEVNDRWCEVTGIHKSHALGDGWATRLHDDDRQRVVLIWRQAIDVGTDVDVEYRLQTRDGSYRWFRAQAALRTDDTENPVLWYGTLEDIDERKNAEIELRNSEERFRLAAQAAGLGIWDYDAVRDVREWSDEFKAMLGLPCDVESDVLIALSLVVPEDRHILTELVDAVRSGRTDKRFEVSLRINRADTGELRWMQTCGWVVQAPSRRLQRVLVTVRDTTEERTAAERVRWSANHDSLTGLANRGNFNAVLDDFVRVSALTRQPFALVLLDVDHLKETNDTIGHDAGDLLLRTFAARLQAGLPMGAFAARLGGDEFAILMRAEDEAHARSMIDRLMAANRQPLLHLGEALICQATGGMSMFPHDGECATDLLKAADIALYVGKAGDKGAIHTFHPDMRNKLQRRASMFALARVGLNEQRIVPCYQPKVSLADRRIVGLEALLRWHHPSLGLQGPDTIAAAFDDYNIAVELSDFMLDRICADMRDWTRAGLNPGRMAVNLSPAEFRHDNLAERVLGHIQRYDLSPSQFEVEVTETVFLEGAAETTAVTLGKLHRAGVSIALDDFGTGYASLTHLKAFPVDVIKIDKRFVSNLTIDDGDNAIVEAMIWLATRLGMTIVAEGVETEAQAAHLIGAGCTHAQGYLFGKALPSTEITALLDRR